MATVEMFAAVDSQNFMRTVSWDSFRSSSLECRALLCPEEEGGFSIHALQLPGVVSQGETEAEAVAAIAEAFRAAISEYRTMGQSIPWTPVDVDDAPRDSKQLWIVVDV